MPQESEEVTDNRALLFVLDHFWYDQTLRRTSRVYFRTRVEEWERIKYSRPAFVANLFNESSLSP